MSIRSLRRGITAAASALAALAVTLPTTSAPAEAASLTRSAQPTLTTHDFPVYPTGDHDAGVFTMSNGSAAYCIEYDWVSDGYSTFDQASWSQFPGENPDNRFTQHAGEINWILQHGYPALNVATLEATVRAAGGTITDSLSPFEAARATQEAIWELTDPGKYNGPWPEQYGWQSGASAADIASVTSYLLDNATWLAAGKGAAPTVDVAPANTSGNSGDVLGPVTITTGGVGYAQVSISGLGAGSQLTDASGAPMDVNLDAVQSGTQLYFTVADDAAAGEITVDAAVQGADPASTGTLLVSTERINGDRGQSLIEVSPASASDTAVVTWAPAAVPPTLGTTASDQADGDKVIDPAGGTIVDVAKFTGLTPGKTYTLSGKIFNKTTGKLTGITATREFTPTAANGTVALTFTIPAGYANSTLVVYETILDGTTIIVDHSDPNDQEQTVTVPPLPPTLGTSASDQADGDKLVPASGGTIVDVLEYTNLTPGQEYTINGELFNKTTGKLTGITATAKLTPTAANGTAEVLFTVPAGFDGQTLVVYEELLDVDGTIVAEHKDPEDEDQTVYVPSIGTSAADQKDGDKTMDHAGGAIVDVVAYTNLLPGQTYTVNGELVDKSTGAPTGITGTATFTPTASSGTVEVLFTLPAGHAGKSLVVFERLLDANGTIIATHEDIDDAAQTVAVNTPPRRTPGVPPVKPVAPVPSKPSLANTGTNASPMLLLGGLLIAAGAGTLTAGRRKRTAADQPL
ncbi:VaFE repeat-containing surface-anchored protein [Blastococcus sp. Marseille-P5729]|uniref:VaFE repeat-containing surface-anchored protein n=1 Tax=Blastococcus sp. Marseille-P5729 TaxID=2086582 RepID=UPI000D0E8EBD|nr:VaFE repeat-containing surface-anchored protein [Blastococcus sp. Marseille-P5729]